MKKPFNKYFIVLVLGFALWIGETVYFGFNDKPESGLEGLLDVVSFLMMIYGVVGDLLTNLRIHKHYHNINTTNIRTKRVEVTGDNQKIAYNTTIKNMPLPKDKK